MHLSKALRRSLQALTAATLFACPLAGCSAAPPGDGSASAQSTQGVTSPPQCAPFEQRVADNEGRGGTTTYSCIPVTSGVCPSVADECVAGVVPPPAALLGCTNGRSWPGIDEQLNAVWLCPAAMMPIAGYEHSTGPGNCTECAGVPDPDWVFVRAVTQAPYLDGGTPGSGCGGPCGAWGP